MEKKDRDKHRPSLLCLRLNSLFDSVCLSLLERVSSTYVVRLARLPPSQHTVFRQQTADPFLLRGVSSQPEKQLDEFTLTDFFGWLQDLEKLIDQTGKLLTGDVVMRPTELAMTVKDFGNRLF